MFFYIFTFVSLVSEWFFFTPFFLCAYLFLFKKKRGLWLGLWGGFLWDLFWVLKMGTSSIVFIGFLLALQLYGIRFNSRSQLFLFIFLAGFSWGWGTFLGISWTSMHLFLFSAFFLALTFELKKVREVQKRVG